MSPSSITRLLAQSGEIILRWSDNPFDPALEFPVEIVNEEHSGAIIRAPRKIGEETPVTLLAKNFMVNGIVRFCRRDKDYFLLTVSTDDIFLENFERSSFHDPGPLVVDDFLTEEEEAKILESLGNSSRSVTRDSAWGIARFFRLLSWYRFVQVWPVSLLQTA